MVLITLSPKWFFGYDIALELSFSIILLIVSLFAYRLFRKTDQESIRYFSIGYALMGISYLLQSIFNFLVLSKLNEDIHRMLKLQTVLAFNNIGLYLHIIFMSLGLIFLHHAITRKKSTRYLWLISIIALTGIFYSTNTFMVFFLFSSIILCFISYHFIRNYYAHRQPKTLLIALAFVFLLFGNIHFLVSVNHQLFYVAGHIVELAAYMLILTNFYLIKSKTKKG